jgi:cytidyltransferase-like protein
MDKKSIVKGSAIGLKPGFEEPYKALHRNTFPGVLKRIRDSNITDYTIFLHNGILFSHMVYEGKNMEHDMLLISEDQVTQEWWVLTDAMQAPFEGRKADEWWADLTEVFSSDMHSNPGKVKRFAFVTDVADGKPFLPPRGNAEKAPGSLKKSGIRVFQGFGKLFTYLEAIENDAKMLADQIHEILGLPAPGPAMEAVFHAGAFKPQKVFVTGCFDMLHSGHVAFLQEAAGYGDLYVSIGSDANVEQLKGRYPVNSQTERKYMIEALACVKGCMINTGWGLLDFVEELGSIRPDVFVVNEDGHSPSKQALCRQMGIEYKVLKRIPHPGLPSRSTTALRTQCNIPFRIDLAGGWLDQPWVSKQAPGPVITISIEPGIEFNERSGMASSTRRKAIELWRNEIPTGNHEQLARLLFSFENPPGTSIVAGSQDALGIVMPGLNKLDYKGGYWPEKITSVHDEDLLAWMEDHLFLVTLGPRVGDFNVLENTRIHPEAAQNLAIAANNCWDALLCKDLLLFGQAFRQSFEAQIAMFPNMVDESIFSIIETYRSRALGWKLSGAGGGGYLILVAQQPIEGSIKIKIRRKDTL